MPRYVLRKILSGIFIYGLADFIGKSASFVLIMYAAFLLQPKDYGILELMLTIVSFSGFIVNFGISNGVMRNYWDRDNLSFTKVTLVSTGLFSQIVIGALVFCVFVCVAFFGDITLDGDLISPISILAAISGTVLYQWLQYSTDVLRVVFNAWRVFFLSVFYRVIFLVIFILLINYFSTSYEVYFYAQAIAGLVSVVFAFIFIGYLLDIKSFNFKCMTGLLVYGYPFVFVAFGHWLLTAVDRWFIVFYYDFEQVGYYSAASRIAYVVMLISFVINQAWSPLVIKIKSELPNFYKGIMTDVFFISFYALIFLSTVLLAFSNEILNFLLDGSFQSARNSIILLVLANVLFGMQGIVSIGISISKNTKIFAIVITISVGLNCILNMMLVPLFGISGAALATLVCQIFVLFSYYILSQRYHPIPIGVRGLSFVISLWLFVLWFHLSSTDVFQGSSFIPAVVSIIFLGLVTYHRGVKFFRIQNGS